MDRDRKRLEVIAQFLHGETTLALATVTREGSARVAPLFYLLQEGLNLYWFSSESSEHSRNLEQNRPAAVSVYRHTAEWKQIRGVQMRGTVSALPDRSVRSSIGKAYTERFHLGKRFAAAISTSILYRFQPDWVRYIDNSRRLGYHFEVSLEPPCSAASSITP